MDFLKSVAGKVVSGLVALAVLVCGVTWFRTDPTTRDALLGGAGHVAAWGGIVLVVPWLAFALIGWVARLESNAAAAVLVIMLTGMELATLAWLFSWRVAGPTAWSFLVLGGLSAGLYNLLACDWIAEKWS